MTEQHNDDLCGILALAAAIEQTGTAIDDSPMVTGASSGTWLARRSFLSTVGRVIREWAKDAAL